MEKDVIALDDYPQLLRKIDRIKRRRDQAKGAYNQLLHRLKAEFGCLTMKEAKALLETMIDRRDAALKRYAKVKKAFEEKWKHVLED